VPDLSEFTYALHWIITLLQYTSGEVSANFSKSCGNPKLLLVSGHSLGKKGVTMICFRPWLIGLGTQGKLLAFFIDNVNVGMDECVLKIFVCFSSKLRNEILRTWVFNKYSDLPCRMHDHYSQLMWNWILRRRACMSCWYTFW